MDDLAGSLPGRRRRVTAALAGTLGVTGAAVVAVAGLGGGSHPRAAVVQSPVVRPSTADVGPSAGAAPAVAAVAAVAAVVSKAAVPARAVARPVPHDRVAAAVPHAFSISGPAFSISAHVCSMDATLPLDPPGEQHHTVCWVNNRFGVAPGSATGTSFILGHAWAEDRREVLNALSSRATAQLLTVTPRMVDGVRTYPVTALNGYVVTLRTSRGILRYRVRDAYGVNKYAAHNVRAMWSSTIANRLVIITCAERAGRDYEDNIVVEAYLISSQRTA
jgi:hypothetical protein